MKSKSLKWSILIIALGLVFSFALVNKKSSFPQNIENLTLSTTTSQERISFDELAYWDNVIWEVVPTYPLENGAASRLFAYLYNGWPKLDKKKAKIS